MLNALLPILTVSFFAICSYAADGQFESVYTDNSNKVSWGKTVSNIYTNGCADANGQQNNFYCTFDTLADGSHQVKVEDSYAAKACSEIGARLPTKQEIDSLVRNFDHTEESQGPKLTAKAHADIEKVLRHIDGQLFWSSSVYTNNSELAYIYDGTFGGVYKYGGYRKFPIEVRCVVTN